MTSHGGGFPNTGRKRPIKARCSGIAGSGAADWVPGSFAIPDDRRAAAASPIETGRGFRHFLRTPEAHEQCRFAIGPDRPSAETRLTLSHLVKRMRAGPRTDDATRDNPRIPSGYTYLLQFVAHDLVQSSLSLSVGNPADAGIENLRGAPLRLATLYGGGPAGTPAAFAIDDPVLQTRTKFRLGPIHQGADAAQSFRDIARAPGQRADGRAMPGQSEVLIADPRNDDHAILSQMTVLFQLLHNIFVSMLPTSSEDKNFPEMAAARWFLCARDATTLVYRHILRTKLLDLLLEPRIYERYSETPDPFLDRQCDGMPLEFSHAAFRIGHAMVRDRYVINSDSPEGRPLEYLLMRSSGRAPELMPLGPNWIVQWSNFFNLGTVPANLSRRIGPEYSAGLMNEQMFPHIDETQELGLAYRDLVSGATAGLWSVDALVAEIHTRSPDLLPVDLPLINPESRRRTLEQWLRESPPYRALSDSEIDSLASDPPLPFFILFEADHEAGGLRLGTLGSVIVAEVMFRALGADGGEPLPQGLARISKQYFGRNFLGSVGELNDMANLITFVAKAAGMTTIRPAFI